MCVLTKDCATGIGGVAMLWEQRCAGRCKVQWGCSYGTPTWNTYQEDVCAPPLWLVGKDKEGWGGQCSGEGAGRKVGFI